MHVSVYSCIQVFNMHNQCDILSNPLAFKAYVTINEFVILYYCIHVFKYPIYIEKYKKTLYFIHGLDN